ncbi:MAG TPA: YbgC/FadM family acyl-CoA thioesterase [Deltaproteobacteria bacterium]|nr:YbgC/FadM family acyl-CoA thioesterase [Deltaproteobacteria bacterium]
MRFDYKIYYEDTDAAGVVYFANYLKFLERAKTDLMAVCGISIAKWHKKAVYLAVRKVNIRYRSPVELEDKLTVDIKIKSIKKASIQCTYCLTVEGRVVCEAEIDSVCMNEKKRPLLIPKEWRTALENISVDL